MTTNRYADKTEKELIELVWEAQNACNIYALINAFPDFIKRLRELIGYDEARNHIAVQWFADKIADLAGRELKSPTERQKLLFAETCYP